MHTIYTCTDQQQQKNMIEIYIAQFFMMYMMYIRFIAQKRETFDSMLSIVMFRAQKKLKSSLPFQQLSNVTF